MHKFKTIFEILTVISFLWFIMMSQVLQLGDSYTFLIVSAICFISFGIPLLIIDYKNDKRDPYNPQFHYYTNEEILFIESLAITVNRSFAQEHFLAELLQGDLYKLWELEYKIKNNHIYYCPADLEECEKILAMGDNNSWCKIDFKIRYHG